MKDKCQHHPLFQPLLPTTTTTSVLHRRQVDLGNSNYKYHDSSELVSSSNPYGFLFRFALVISFGIISLWANYEASKGHTITIVNEAQNTVQGKRFDLFYQSNGKASRMVYETSKFVENFLYPNNDNNNSTYAKKKINHVILRLSSSWNMLNTEVAVVVEERDQFVISISSSVMDESNHSRAMLLAIQKGMAGVWVWDGEGEAPKSLVNGIVKYIIGVAAGTKSTPEEMVAVSPRPVPDCYRKDKHDAKVVAEFLNYCEMTRPGFIRRLNQQRRSRWRDEQTLDSALGMPIWDLCVRQNSSAAVSAGVLL